MQVETETANYWLQLGTENMRKGLFVEASNCFRRALAQRPDDCQIMHKLGYSLLSQGSLDDALACFNKILSKNPNDALAIARKASVLKCLDRTSEAKTLCQQALELAPESEEIMYELGSSFLEYNNNGFGKELIDRVLARNPNHAEATYSLGLWYWHQLNISEAKKYLAKAISIDVDMKSRLYSLVQFYKTMSSSDLSLYFLEQCLDFDLDDPQYHLNRGYLLLDLDRSDEAIQAFQMAATIAPNEPTAYYDIGRIYFMRGDFNNAFEMLSRTIELDPEHSEALTTLAAIYCDSFANYPKALEMVKKALLYDDKLTQAWINQGIILGHIGNLAEAIASFDMALSIEPNNTMALLRKGGLLNDRLHLYDEAIKLFNKAVQLDPHDSTCWWNLSQAFIDKNDIEQAIHYLNKVIEVAPMDTGAMANKGILLSRLGRNQEARKTFIELLQINPTDPRAHQALSVIPQEDGIEISGQFIYVLRMMAQKDPMIRNFLSGIVKNSDRLLASVFVAQMRKFFTSDQAKNALPDVAEELGRLDDDILITWLTEQGAAEILK